ncbi:MAG: hypothetical protein CL726_03755 [Chloroflexi bacterium]|nr:hypothetical protein [Chloroflexota bacterium]
MRSMFAARSVLFLSNVLLATTIVACSSTESRSSSADPPVVSDSIEALKFDVDSFAAINPTPKIREFDPYIIDFGFTERDKLPRDAIEPVYTPKFVTPANAQLSPDEIAMGW